MQGVVFVIVLLYVLTNLAVELVQTFLDPKERARLLAAEA